MRKQTFKYYFKAKPGAIYQAMLDPKLLSQWRIPDDMRMMVHSFDPKQGGKFRISLIYDDPQQQGKSTENIDTYHGYFKKLVPSKEIIEVIEFESPRADFKGEMILITQLIEKGSGTELIATHENLPEAVPEDQNEIGWKMSFEKLDRLLRDS